MLTCRGNFSCHTVLVMKLAHRHSSIGYLLAQADGVMVVQGHHGVLGLVGHRGRRPHRDLGQWLPSSRVLGKVDHALLLALGTVCALLLTCCPKIGHSPAAVALAGYHIHHALLLAGHAVGGLGSTCDTHHSFSDGRNVFIQQGTA